MATTLNHELCHLLGLNHPFQEFSRCADAPTHPDYPNFLQCWNLDPNNPHCDAWSKASNNLMDYNAHQSSLSPCQIGIMQDNLNSCLQSRYVYKCDNCRPTRALFSLLHGYRTSTPIPGRPGSGFWLDGRASFNHNSFKLEIDEVLSSGFGSGLRKHYEKTESREVGLENIGSLYNFVNGRTYQVILRTYNGCGSAAVHVETFEYHNLSQVSRSNALAAPIIANPLSSSTRHE